MTFGQTFGAGICKVRRSVGRSRFLDEVFTRLGGTMHYLWRAFHRYGVVAGILVESRQNRAATERLFRHLLRSSGVTPHTIPSERLASFKLAVSSVLPRIRHRRSHWLNNRAENSH